MVKFRRSKNETEILNFTIRNINMELSNLMFHFTILLKRTKISTCSLTKAIRKPYKSIITFVDKSKSIFSNNVLNCVQDLKFNFLSFKLISDT